MSILCDAKILAFLRLKYAYSTLVIGANTSQACLYINNFERIYLKHVDLRGRQPLLKTKFLLLENDSPDMSPLLLDLSIFLPVIYGLCNGLTL